MKKTLIILAVVALLSGCQAKPTPVTNTNMNTNTNGQSTSLQATYAKLGLEDLLGQYNGAIIKTNFGDIKVSFYNNDSPLTVNNFMNLAKKGFYDDTKFHRVIADFMIQGGDPNSKDDDWSNDGIGGPGYKFKDEINTHKLVKGSLAMANSGVNTNGSQFFIVTAPATNWLDGKHTNFGAVIEGLDVVAKIEAVKVNENDHPTKDVIINSIELIKID
jgi:cyclophilin family peptidyl-prolyl cis-trans isomerase